MSHQPCGLGTTSLLSMRVSPTISSARKCTPQAAAGPPVTILPRALLIAGLPEGSGSWKGAPAQSFPDVLSSEVPAAPSLLQGSLTQDLPVLRATDGGVAAHHTDTHSPVLG